MDAHLNFIFKQALDFSTSEIKHLTVVQSYLRNTINFLSAHPLLKLERSVLLV